MRACVCVCVCLTQRHCDLLSLQEVAPQAPPVHRDTTHLLNTDENTYTQIHTHLLMAYSLSEKHERLQFLQSLGHICQYLDHFFKTLHTVSITTVYLCKTGHHVLLWNIMHSLTKFFKLNLCLFTCRHKHHQKYIPTGQFALYILFKTFKPIQSLT